MNEELLSIPYYNYENIVNNVNNISVHYIASLSSSPNDFESSGIIKKFNSLSTMNDFNVNFSNRIGIYTYMLKDLINNNEHISNIFTYKPDSYITLAAANEKILIENTTQHLTGLSDLKILQKGKYVTSQEQRYFILSYIVRYFTRYVTNTDSFLFNDINKIDAKILKDKCSMFNKFDEIYLSLILKNSYNELYKEKIIRINDLLYILQEFILNLKNIYNLNSNIVFYKNSLSSMYQSLIDIMGLDLTRNKGSASLDNSEYNYVSLITTPYVLYRNVSNNKLIQTNIHNTFINENNELQISSCVKFNSKKYPSIISNFQLNENYSNGEFLFNSYFIISLSENELTLQKIISLFELKRNEIISLKKILNSIDYIFYQWLINILCININIDICHNNCHCNTVINTLYSTISCGTCEKTEEENTYILENNTWKKEPLLKISTC